MKKYFITGAIFISFFLIISQVGAQMLNDTNGLQTMTEITATEAGLGNVDLGFLVASIIQAVLGLLGIIFLVLIIMAGFRWMTAAGNEEQAKKSASTIKDAVIGLIIVLAAYAITYFIFKYIPFSGTSGMPNPI